MAGKQVMKTGLKKKKTKKNVIVNVESTEGSVQKVEIPKDKAQLRAPRKLKKRKHKEAASNERTTGASIERASLANTGVCQLCDGLVAPVPMKCRGCGKAIEVTA
eukprot:TRINITY_DN12001_c0_g1_i1.p1 TRINITY_DN12001_c0_g1~~TRINITY_DN12001_c0_g1_i1.p1  ORF type:complete len:121 (-),score=14.96 TRINITY_DN12001_c0_g1_i1:237-551(-)